MSPAEVAVQHQLDAYNARDLERFVADSIVVDQEWVTGLPPALDL